MYGGRKYGGTPRNPFILLLFSLTQSVLFDSMNTENRLELIKARRILLSARLFIELLFGPVDDLETGFDRNRF